MNQEFKRTGTANQTTNFNDQLASCWFFLHQNDPGPMSFMSNLWNGIAIFAAVRWRSGTAALSQLHAQ